MRPSPPAVLPFSKEREGINEIIQAAPKPRVIKARDQVYYAVDYALANMLIIETRDATVSFCARFLDQRSRTVDQMVQAARSGRQNIAEGSRASATSTQTELRLVNVARASLDELLLDYEDFLRQDGGYSERLAAERIRERQKQDRADRSDRTTQTLPPCPLCGRPLVVRTARKGTHAGSQFLGCSGYPNCRGTLPLDGSVRSD